MFLRKGDLIHRPDYFHSSYIIQCKKIHMKPMGFQWHLTLQVVIATRKQCLAYQIKHILQALFPNCSVLFPINSHVHVEGKRKTLFQPHIHLRCCLLNAGKQKQPISSHTYQMNALFI